MTQANEVRIERILEPRLAVDSLNQYIALIGAGFLNYRTITTTSVTDARVVFPTLDPPDGASSIIGRKIYVTFRFNIQFTTAAGTNTTNKFSTRHKWNKSIFNQFVLY
jgi:hypothetical protein